jgi:hypothetical protein
MLHAMPRRRLTAILGSESLVIVVGAAYVLLALAILPEGVRSDTWLALVGGRVVASSGLPGLDTLTAWTRGEEWVDQQWLGQLAFHGLASLGGLKLVLLAHVASVGAAFGSALAAARWRGGSPATVARVAIVALLSVLIVTATVRTQSFAYILFVAVLWLAIADHARPSRRVIWIVPLLALWANVHGSVVLGAVLVGLSGAIFVVRGLRARDAQLRHGALVLAIGLLAPMASPYVLELGSYYASTLLNSEFGDLVTEWKSPTPSVATAPFYLLGGLTLWLIGRSGDRLTVFERAVLVVTLLAGLSAIRNIVWFALAAMILVPVAADRSSARDEPRSVPSFAAAVSAAAIVAVLGAGVLVGAGTATGHEERYPPRVAAATWQAAQRDPSSTIFAEEAYADWLLWRHPSLAGRVLFDARFELLSERQLRDIRIFKVQAGPRWRDVIGDARILVLNHERRALPELPSAAEVLTREGRFRQVARDGDVVVLTRAAP